MPASQYGADYSRWMNMPASPLDPFPTPMTEAQRVENARARARRAGVDIGSGYLHPQSGELQDPDRGFMRVIGNHPELGMLLAIGGPLAAQAALGGLGAASASGGASSIIPGTGIPTVAGAGGAAALPVAPTAAGLGTAAATGGAGATASVIDKIRKSLTDPSAYAALAPLIASLAMGSGGGPASGGGNDELRRIQGITEARMRRVDPLHQVATQLAFQRAPITARNGIDLTNVRLPE